MNRFFISTRQFESEEPVITGPDVRHIVRVLRLVPGDVVELLDGSGRGIQARILKAGPDAVSCSRMAEFVPGGEPGVKVTLVQGLAKGEKMETVIQKATELGVFEIMPAACRRSVVRLDRKSAEARAQRWQRVALEAAKQCRRAIIPQVHTLQEFASVLDRLPGDVTAVLPWEEEHGLSLDRVLSGEKADRLFLFIGPEGGFTGDEVNQARARGVSVVTLGPRILRTETAGPACLAVVMHRWGDLG